MCNGCMPCHFPMSTPYSCVFSKKNGHGSFLNEFTLLSLDPM